MTNLIRVFLHPSCWLQNNGYSPIWDSILNQAMDRYKFTNPNAYYASLGPMRLWITNHPYASFVCPITGLRPKRSTILKAMDKLLKDVHDPQ